MKCPSCHSDIPDGNGLCPKCGVQAVVPGNNLPSRTERLPAAGCDPLIGTTLAGKYRVVKKLERGGMGIVYQAEDVTLKRTVALKFLAPELVCDPDWKARLTVEAQAAAALSHPNICTIYEIHEAEGRSFIVMEYVEGQSLTERVQAGVLKPEQALEVAGQVALGLEEAHRKGIIHRDIKSANIMVTPSGVVKIMDFGLAKQQGSPALTREGMTMGTLAYMSPEQLRGEAVDGRTDLWALGVVVFEMLTGRRPFRGEEAASMTYSILHEKPESLRSVDPKFPPELDHIVHRALQKNRGSRYATAGEMLKELTDTLAFLKGPVGGTASFKFLLRRARRPVLVAAALVVLGLAGVGWWLAAKRGVPSGSTKSPPCISSLAVKPLDDYSGDTNLAYLSDGMTEALCNALGNISALRVPGRASVMRFKGGQKSIQEMARELTVDAIVEGSVQRAGNQIRVTAKLIEAATDRQLWGTNYNRDLSDFFLVQDEVARAIAAEIQVLLTAEDQARLARARTAKPEAIEAYLRGMQQWWQWTDEGMTKARGHFETAIDIDPDYAPAHAGLALAYVLGSSWIRVWSPGEGGPRGKAAAQEAIRLDPRLAEPYVALGYARMAFDWDWAGAEKDLTNALELSPRSPLALAGYANCLVVRGRFSEATNRMTAAVESDPKSPALRHSLGWTYWAARQFDQAILQFEEALKLDPNFHISLELLGWCHLLTGETNRALAEFQRLKELHPDWQGAQASLGYAYGATGHRAEARQVLADLKRPNQKRHVSPMMPAEVHLGLGQTNEALDLLEQACQERDGWFVINLVEPPLFPLRDHLRFKELRKNVGLDK